LNNKFAILKKSSTMLLATVLVVGFIGVATPSSIFAQNYNDDYESEYSQYYDDAYEKSYEKYIKDDYSQPSKKNIKINCDNSSYNPPINVNVNIDNSDPTNGEVSLSGDTSRSSSNGDSQSSHDRMNSNKDSNQKGNFKVICQNNNNVNVNPTINTVTNTNIDSATFQAQGFCLQANQQNAAAGDDATNTGVNEISVSGSDGATINCGGTSLDATTEDSSNPVNNLA
jgi:hypothetical protein